MPQYLAFQGVLRNGWSRVRWRADVGDGASERAIYIDETFCLYSKYGYRQGCA
jgi:hypothetical protein